MVSEATVKVHVERRADRSPPREGNGPVNALDAALRSALAPYHPELAGMELADYKVRILARARTAPTRSPGCWWSTADGRREWTTVGVHANVVEASWLALVDAVQYGLLAA